MKLSFSGFVAAIALFLLTSLNSCSENYSNGERIGMITQFSKAGFMWKTYEGHLNMTQTGMNSSQAFDFSIDRDNEDVTVIAMLDSAAEYGWKVKLKYHETLGWNWFNNRGDTDHFITEVEVLDRNPLGFLGKQQEGVNNNHAEQTQTTGRVIDTIYVVIYQDKPQK